MFSDLPIVIGALVGATLGYFGQCSSGTCPLTSICSRGATYGAVMSALLCFSANGTNAETGQRDLSQAEQDQTVVLNR